ncbi:MAG: hypothetical protein GTO18_20270 [Anaerolineales bacterium]|nr:hypothetical protein [Anaerolineales bacterium]
MEIAPDEEKTILAAIQQPQSSNNRRRENDIGDECPEVVAYVSGLGTEKGLLPYICPPDPRGCQDGDLKGEEYEGKWKEWTNGLREIAHGCKHEHEAGFGQ